MSLIYEQESYVLRGVLFEVYKEMGGGFLEAVYQECLERELSLLGVSYQSQPNLRLSYKGQMLEQTYKPDFIIDNKIIVELKAVTKLRPEHEAQVINYLKATGFKLAFLVNFSAYPKLDIRRFVL